MSFQGPKVVKVRRVPKAGYFGISAYPKSTTVLSCQLSKNGFKTGLTKEEEAYYETQLNLKPNELSRHSKWWGEVFNTEHTIRLNNNKANEIILDSPINQLRYKVLLEHSKIANSELEKHRPDVLFYIDDAEAKAKAEIQTINFKYEGMKLIMKLTTSEKQGALRLFDKKGVDELSEDMASSQLFMELEKDPKRFFDTMTDEELKSKAWIYELVEKGHLRRRGTAFIHGDETIAGDLQECVEYFQNPKNQTIKLTLTTKLNKGKTKEKAIKE